MVGLEPRLDRHRPQTFTSEEVNRIAEVDLSAHIEVDAEIIAIGRAIASYYSSTRRPTIPYWTLGFADATLRLLGSDDSLLP